MGLGDPEGEDDYSYYDEDKIIDRSLSVGEAHRGKYIDMEHSKLARLEARNRAKYGVNVGETFDTVKFGISAVKSISNVDMIGDVR